MSVVIDASAALHLWLSPTGQALADRLAGHTLHVPSHFHVEASNVIRRQRNAGILEEAAAREVFEGIMLAPVRNYPFSSVASRVRELGANMTGYDAAYVALAECLRMPLVTHDAKLARVPGIRCSVEVL